MSDEASSGERRFAFFDLDLTLVPFDTQLLFCNHVLRREGWRRVYLFIFLPCALLYALKLIGDAGMKRVFCSFLWRMKREDLDEHAARFVETDVMPRLYGEALPELERHRAEGREIVLNTASPAFYVGPIAERLDVDHWFATRVLVGERVPFLPRIDRANNKGPAKIESMRGILPRDRQPPYDDSYGYGDSAADAPMMKLAAHGVMIHPEGKLLAIGEERGWETRTPAQPYRGKWARNWIYLQQVFGVWRG